MRRATRTRRLSIAAYVSAMICAATVAIWILSYHYYEGIDWNRPTCLVGLKCSSGLFWFECSRADVPLWRDDDGNFMGVHPVFLVPEREEYAFPLPVKSNRAWGNIKFGSFCFLVSDRRRETWLAADYLATAPAWAVALASILPLTWYWRATKRIQRRGSCPTCGYDLRATPDRCPECGTKISN